MNEPVRVLHVFGKLNRGGAETRTMEIYRAIDKSKVQFDFALHTEEKCSYDDEVILLGGKIYKGIPRYKIFNSIKYCKAWNDFFKTHRYDIIHVHTTNSAVPIFYAARRNKVKHKIAHARQADEYSTLRRLYNNINKPLLRKFSDERLAVSDMAGEFIFGKDYITVKNAVNAGVFRYNQTVREKVRNESGIDGTFSICHIGSIYSVKNHSFLIDIFHKTNQSLPNAKLFIIGDGELRAETEDKVSKLGLSDKVHFLGVRKDIPELLQAMDLMLLPSHYEGLPGAALEAQAAGLKIIMSDKITREATIVPDLAEYLPIDKGAEIWADRIAEIAKGDFTGRDTFEDIRKAGYDIMSVAGWYEEFYLGMAGATSR